MLYARTAVVVLKTACALRAIYRARYVSRAPRLLYSARQQQSCALPPDSESTFRVRHIAAVYNINVTTTGESMSAINTIINICFKLFLIMLAMATWGFIDITDMLDDFIDA